MYIPFQVKIKFAVTGRRLASCSVATDNIAKVAPCNTPTESSFFVTEIYSAMQTFFHPLCGNSCKRRTLPQGFFRECQIDHLRHLGPVVAIVDGPGADAVAQRKDRIVFFHQAADPVELGIEWVFLAGGVHPRHHEGAALGGQPTVAKTLFTQPLDGVLVDAAMDGHETEAVSQLALNQLEEEFRIDLMVTAETYFTGTQRDLLYLSLTTGKVVSLYAEDIESLEGALEEKLAVIGRMPVGNLVPFLQEREIGDVIKERTVADGKMWYQVPSAGIHSRIWRPGWLYLTVERLLWWSDFDHRVGLEIPLGRIREISLVARDLGGLLDEREVLTIVYENHQGQEEALFSGEMLLQWRQQIKAQVLDHGDGDFHA